MNSDQSEAKRDNKTILFIGMVADELPDLSASVVCRIGDLAAEFFRHPAAAPPQVEAQATPAPKERLTSEDDSPGWYECKPGWDIAGLFLAVRFWDGRELRHGPTDSIDDSGYTNLIGPLVHAPALQQQIASLQSQLAEAKAEVERLLNCGAHFRGKLRDALGVPSNPGWDESDFTHAITELRQENERLKESATGKAFWVTESEYQSLISASNSDANCPPSILFLKLPKLLTALREAKERAEAERDAVTKEAHNHKCDADIYASAWQRELGRMPAKTEVVRGPAVLATGLWELYSDAVRFGEKNEFSGGYEISAGEIAIRLPDHQPSQTQETPK